MGSIGGLAGPNTKIWGQVWRIAKTSNQTVIWHTLCPGSDAEMKSDANESLSQRTGFHLGSSARRKITAAYRRMLELGLFGNHLLRFYCCNMCTS
eukprot:1159662-Pelagomonas_calceolata.AAC.3